MGTDEKREYYFALEGIRGIAAILVAIRHFQPTLSQIQSPMSFLAVDLFFAISGFVIASSYEHKMQSGALTFKNFFIYRLIRLYPLYILGSGIGLIWLVLSQDEGSLRIGIVTILTLSFLPNPLSGLSAFPVNAPAWSLFFELTMSIVYGLWLCTASNRKVVITTALAFVGFTAVIIIHGDADVGFQKIYLPVGMLRITSLFGFGLLAFRCREHIIAFVPTMRNAGTTILYLMVIAILAAPISKLAPYATLYSIAVVSFGVPAIICIAIRANPTGQLRSVSLFLGRISFPLYAIHSPVYQLGSEIYDGLLPGKPPVSSWIGLLALAATVVLAAFLNRYYDIPARGWLRRTLDNH